VLHFGYDGRMDELGSTPLSRRSALALLGGAGASGVLACSASPAIEEGPFFVDERLNRSDLTAGATNAGVTRGAPLRLAFRVSTDRGGACVPLAGAHVDVWHADATGLYSDEAVLRTSGERFLRGYQVTGRDGAVAFRTVYPGWYPGRTPHVHLKVRTFTASGDVARSFTSQLYFDETVTDVTRRMRATTCSMRGCWSNRAAPGRAMRRRSRSFCAARSRAQTRWGSTSDARARIERSTCAVSAVSSGLISTT